MGRVEGKVALITGGAQGMGAAHAQLLAAEGARVVIGDILYEQGLALAGVFADSAQFRHLDVTQPADWSAAVEATLSRFGKLDVLVNNAGTRAGGASGHLRPQQVAPRHRRQPHRNVLGYARRRGTDDIGWERLDHQHFLYRGPSWGSAGAPI